MPKTFGKDAKNVTGILRNREEETMPPNTLKKLKRFVVIATDGQHSACNASIKFIKVFSFFLRFSINLNSK